MRILTGVEIYNFQCHKHSKFSISPSGLTVITGPSHHGKSAVVRAVGWVLYNRPQGNEFFRHGTKECRVILSYSDGVAVERRKTVSLNQYWIRFEDKEKKDQLFEGFGYDVPFEVQKITGCFNYKIDDNKTLYLNIAEQGEGLFLGSKTATDTQRAKILGKLAGTEDVDRANKKLGTDIYHAKEDKKKYEADIQEKDEKIKEYSWVKPLGEKLQKLEALQERIQADSERWALLVEKREQLRKLDTAINQQILTIRKYYSLPAVFEMLRSVEPDIPLLVDYINKRNKLAEIENQTKVEKLTIQDCGQPKKAKEILKEVEWSAHNLIKLNGLRGSLRNNKHAIEYNKSQINKCGQVAEAMKAINQCTGDINTYTTLITKKKDYDMYSRQIRTQKMVAEKKYSGMDKAKIVLAGLSSKVTELSTLEDKKKTYQKKSKEVESIEGNVELFHRVIEKAEKESQKAKEHYKEVLKNSGRCPTCGSQVDDECLDHVV